MDVSSIGNGAVATGVDRFAEMSSEDFIKVLFTELQNQDPLAPNDSGALIEQLSGLRNIESQLALQDELKSLVSANQVASAGNLIGKTVAGIDGFNNQVTGVVTSVRVTDDVVTLELDNGVALDMDRVTHIAQQESPTGGSANDPALNAAQQTNQQIGTTNTLLTDLIRSLTGTDDTTENAANTGAPAQAG